MSWLALKLKSLILLHEFWKEKSRQGSLESSCKPVAERKGGRYITSKSDWTSRFAQESVVFCHFPSRHIKSLSPRKRRPHGSEQMAPLTPQSLVHTPRKQQAKTDGYRGLAGYLDPYGKVMSLPQCPITPVWLPLNTLTNLLDGSHKLRAYFGVGLIFGKG